MTLDELQMEIQLHEHFVNRNEEHIGYLRATPIAKHIQRLITFGMEQGWLWADWQYNENWHGIDCRWRLTAAGRKRFFERTS